jgi:hypothetical protein
LCDLLDLQYNLKLYYTSSPWIHFSTTITKLIDSIDCIPNPRDEVDHQIDQRSLTKCNKSSLVSFLSVGIRDFIDDSIQNIVIVSSCTIQIVVNTCNGAISIQIRSYLYGDCAITCIDYNLYCTDRVSSLCISKIQIL